jgi:polyisoprenoid-binding protein YceI
MNKKLGLMFALVLLAAGTASAQTTTWNLDTPHSTVGFSIRHMMISNVHGTFNSFQGTIKVNGEDPASAAVDVSIDAGSIDTREPKRDAHLKSADFFDVAKFPTLTFKSRKVEKVAGGQLKLIGDLTIHGVTKEVTLDVDTLTPPVKDPWGMTRAAAHASATINRKDFGLVWNKALETGGVLVGDEVSISIDVEMVRQQPQAK